MFSFDQTTYKLNGKELEKDEFVNNFVNKIKDVTSLAPQLKFDVDDPLNILNNTDSFILTKNSRERDFARVSGIIRQYLNEFADDYNAETTQNTISFTVDDDCVLYGYSEELPKKDDVVTQKATKPDIKDEYPEIEPNIPSLSNKQYNEFIKLCNETVSFLSDYGEIGQKREFMLTKNDTNNVAKVVFAPMRAWDYVGTECKMTEDDFNLLKSNLVQLNVENGCARLGSIGWNYVFERMKSLKTKNIKFSGNENNFVSKIKTTVLNKKTKSKLGTIILTLSISVNKNVISNEEKGMLPVLDSYISYNIIAR